MPAIVRRTVSCSCSNVPQLRISGIAAGRQAFLALQEHGGRNSTLVRQAFPAPILRQGGDTHRFLK